MPAALQNNPDTLLKMPIGVFDSGLGGLTAGGKGEKQDEAEEKREKSVYTH